jgi:DNA modification methylase
MTKRGIQQGDIWMLGDHTLACGSSTDKDFIDRVFGKRKINCVVTDPPYGVAYVEGKRDFHKLGKGDKVIANDQLQTEEQYVKFTRGWLEPIKDKLEHYNTVYIFNSDLMYRALRTGMEAAGFYYSQMLIWVKNTVVVGRKDYLPMHELIAYGWYGRHKMQRSKAKSIIFHPKPASSKLHPTMKPVGLLRKLIPNTTRLGEHVYDPFGGSGSTLIACEHLGRVATLVELDPGYCETIIARWEKLTGKEAKLLRVVHS